MPEKHPKRPRDLNQWAKSIVDIVAGEASDDAPKSREEGKNPHAVKAGRLGGVKGGAARAAAMSKSERSASARRAAQARWKKP